VSSPTDHFLRRAHRRARYGPLLWSLALAALACALHLAAALAWIPPSLVIPATLAFLSLSLLALWLARARRLSPLSLARRLDSEWALAARLETSAELSADASALAAAQRADTTRHLSNHPTPQSLNWFSACAFLALVALLLLSESSLLGLRYLRAAPDASALAAKTAADAAADLSASLTWKTPESEIKATAIEEIPLTALASSHTGLRSVSLEIAVNGEPRLSRPLDPASLSSLAKPGEHPLELALYLDETGAQEFDLVSYHLRAERIVPASGLSPQVSGLSVPPPLPVVASPLQFIQIRPPREDVTRIKGNGPPGVEKLALLLGNLKAAQLNLLKQNFLLAHAPLDHALPEWREENTRVAADQKLLAQKTSEARDYAIAEALPALAVDNLGQCIPLMQSAATQIAASANEPAAKPQGQALGLIVSPEKLLRKIIIEGGGGPAKPKPANLDPFKDKQQFKLPPRPDTPAGQLEELAQKQADAARQLDDPAGKNPLAEQAALAAKLAALSASKTLDPSAQAKTDQAAKDAAEAARQLAAGDPAAARAPAAAAAQALGEATAAQEAAGRAAAQAELEKIRRELNAAEALTDPAARAAALAAAVEKLHAEATQQQQTGSAEAARQIAAAAKAAAEAAAASSNVEASLAKTAPSPPGTPSSSSASSPPTPSPAPGEGKGQGKGKGESPAPSPSPGEGNGESKAEGKGKGESKAEGKGDSPGEGQGTGAPSAAEAATRAQAALTPRDQALARASRQLGHSGRPGGSTYDVELGAQLAAQLLTDPAARELAREVSASARAEHRPSANTIVSPDLGAAAEKLVALLEAARTTGLRDEQVRRYNPDDLAPAYRPAVEAYFEKLSRDPAKP